MKCEIIDTVALPGGLNIIAETPAECLLLRMFVQDKRPLQIANAGGNIEDHRQSLLIMHAPNKERYL